MQRGEASVVMKVEGAAFIGPGSWRGVELVEMHVDFGFGLVEEAGEREACGAGADDGDFWGGRGHGVDQLELEGWQSCLWFKV